MPTPLDPKARCRRAHQQARADDPRSCALLDRLYAETLLAVENAPPVECAAMLTRTAILFEIWSDRRGWPTVIRGVTKPARAHARA